MKRKLKTTSPGKLNSVSYLQNPNHEPDNQLHDSGAMAGFSGSVYRNSVIFSGGVAQKAENNMTAYEKMQLARNGISKNDLEILKDKTALDYNSLAHALSVTRATLINKKGKEKFSADLSERIVSLADIYSYGYEVFEDADRFNQWMFQSNKALGGEAPYHFMDNQFGREEIRNLIGRIEYGIYS